MFPADFLGLGDDMGDAGLPVRSNPVIGCMLSPAKDGPSHHRNADPLIGFF